MGFVNLRGEATFEVEVEVEDDNIEFQEITIFPHQVDWEIEVHDPDRQMGVEYVHVGTAEVNEQEFQWFVYEYPEGILNTVEHMSHGPSLLKDFEISIEYESEEDLEEDL